MGITAVEHLDATIESRAKVELRSGWLIVAASVMGLAVGHGTVNLFCFGIFLKPVSSDLGVTRTTLSSGLLWASVLTALATPAVGMLVDRFGNRMVMLPGIALFALSVAALSMMQASSLALVYILFGMAGLFAAVQTPTVYATIICKWFDRKRGLALGFAMAGTGLGVWIVPQVTSFTIGAYGWRTAYLVLSALILICAFVPVALFIREPTVLDVSKYGHCSDARSLPGLTTAQALTRSWQFWALSAAFFLGGTAIHGTLTHVVAMLTDSGFGSQAAAAALSLAGLAMLVGRIGCGYCLDRFHGPSVAIGSFLTPMGGIALLASSMTGSAPLVGILLCGLGMGAQIGLQPFFASRYFGLRSVGTISGAMFGVFLAGTGIGPYLSGRCFDAWHSYVPVFSVYATALLLAALLFVPLGPYPFGPAGTKAA
jgi:MFS family permease